MKNRKGEYFLALTTHFFDKQLAYKSLVISFRMFPSSHHSANITEFILCELRKFDVLDKIVLNECIYDL